MNKKTLQILTVFVLLSALYRIIPNRPWGFTPQFSIALFGGSLFSHDKKMSFFLPLLSIVISDIIYQALFLINISPISGFYGGQILNYVLILSITCFGFGLNPENRKSLLYRSSLGATFYFLISNFIVWASGGGYNRDTLLECYIDGLPFYINSIMGTMFFTILIFEGFNRFYNRITPPKNNNYGLR